MKIFGTLTRSQFTRVFRAHPALGKIINSLHRDLAKSEKAQDWKRSRGELVWANLYELPMERIVLIWLLISGEVEAIEQAAAAEDPQEAALHWMEQYEPRQTPDVSSDELMMVVASLIALIYNWAAVGWYSSPLCDLIRRARDGDDDALFKAVSVDPTCLAGPTGAGRLSLAMLKSENKFLKRIQKELKGPNKGRYQYSQHRVAEYILRDAGAFKLRGNREQIFEAVNIDLELAMKRDGDPFKAWTSRVTAWQREATGRSTI